MAQRKAAELLSGQQIPASSHANFARLFSDIWSELPSEIVRNAYRGCGFAFEDGVHFYNDTETESEISSYDDYDDLPTDFDSEDSAAELYATDDKTVYYINSQKNNGFAPVMKMCDSRILFSGIYTLRVE